MPRSLYIGSTPNPVRRLDQHNGKTQGGAHRTHKDSHRPWEMVCVVYGFPSNIGALQFEWSWQNSCFTRHIPDEERVTQPNRVWISSKKSRDKQNHKPKGKQKNNQDNNESDMSKKNKAEQREVRQQSGKWKSTRPTYAITAVLQNLHLLLRVKSFQQWPLHVKFFSEDVFKKWEKAKPKNIILRPEIRVEFDQTKPPADNSNDSETGPPTGTGLHAIDVGYTALRTHLIKSRSILENGTLVSCDVCERSLRPSKSLVVVCPMDDCRSVSHMSCLSMRFLANEKDGTLIPTHGKCPGCRATLEWVSLVKELTLRTRAAEEVEAIIAGKKSKATLSEFEEDVTKLVPMAIHGEKDLESGDNELEHGFILQEDEAFDDGLYLGMSD